MYILVCADLTTAQQIVQVAHAAQRAGALWGAEIDDHVVLCTTQDASTFYRAIEDANLGIRRLALVHEPDLGNRATAAAIEPMAGPDARKPFRRWKLWTPASTESEQELISGPRDG